MGRVWRDKQIRDNDRNKALFRKNRKEARRKRREEALERQQHLFRQYYNAEREVKDYIASDRYQDAINAESSDDDATEPAASAASKESQSDQPTAAQAVVAKTEEQNAPVNYAETGVIATAYQDQRDSRIFNSARLEHSARKRAGWSIFLHVSRGNDLAFFCSHSNCHIGRGATSDCTPSWTS